MSLEPAAELPDLGALLRPVVESVPESARPLLIALLERNAALRYREWAKRPELSDRSAELLRCAEREDEIAARVERMHPDAKRIQAGLLAQLPDVESQIRTLFGGVGLFDQIRIQARAERLGAATWRALARREPGAERSKTLEGCAALEESSAAVLESIAAARA